MTDHEASEVGRIAKGLTKAQRQAIVLFSDAWATCSETGATGMSATTLCISHKGLMERRWTTWGPDRVNHQLRGEGYEYRLTPLGLAVRKHLEGGL